MVDTGGFEPVVDSGILAEMAKQTLQAVDEGDVIIFLVDGRGEITASDRDLAQMLRRLGKPVSLAVNKADTAARNDLCFATTNRQAALLETTVPGVFAVGDVRSGSVKRVGGAIGEGAQVVAALHGYLGDTAKPAL